MFTLGIGSGVSSSLIKGVARAGNGKAEFIADTDRIQPKVKLHVVSHFSSGPVHPYCFSSIHFLVRGVSCECFLFYCIELKFLYTNIFPTILVFVNRNEET